MHLHVCYLFVVLRKQNPDSFHRRAGEAQWTGLAAVARGRVNTLHSREAGVKLTLQEGKQRGERRTVERRRKLQIARGPGREVWWHSGSSKRENAEEGESLKTGWCKEEEPNTYTHIQKRIHTGTHTLWLLTSTETFSALPVAFVCWTLIIPH